MFFGILFQSRSALHVPLPPGSNDLDRRIKVIIGNFKTYLIIALTGSTVGNGIGPFFSGNLHLRLGDQWARNGGAEEVASLVDSVDTEHGKNKVAGKFFFQVDDVTGRGAGVFGFLRHMIKLFPLAEIGAIGNDFAAVFLYQPLENNGGVKASRISQNRFFYLSFFAHYRYSCA